MTFRRDALLASTARRWIIHRAFAGTTSVPLQLRPSEGPACGVRFGGTRFRAHDKRAPPIAPFGGTCLSGPRRCFGGTRLSGPFWRDALVASAARCWSIYPASLGKRCPFDLLRRCEGLFHRVLDIHACKKGLSTAQTTRFLREFSESLYHFSKNEVPINDVNMGWMGCFGNLLRPRN